MAQRNKLGLETKRKLVNIAKDLFFNKGYNDISLVKICKEANVSRASFFYYFSGKAAIATFIADKVSYELVKKIRSRFSEESYSETVYSVIVMMIFYRSILSNNKVLRFFTETMSDGSVNNIAMRNFQISLEKLSKNAPIKLSETEFNMLVISQMAMAPSLLLQYLVGKLDLSRDDFVNYLITTAFLRLGYDSKVTNECLKQAQDAIGDYYVNLEEIFLAPIAGE